MNPFTWIGRVLLWLIFWPVGLWRSLAHGRNRRHKELVRAIKGDEPKRGVDIVDVWHRIRSWHAVLQWMLAGLVVLIVWVGNSG